MNLLGTFAVMSFSMRNRAIRSPLLALVVFAAVSHCPMPHSGTATASGVAFAEPQAAAHGDPGHSHDGRAHPHRSHSADAHSGCDSEFTRPAIADGAQIDTPISYDSFPKALLTTYSSPSLVYSAWPAIYSSAPPPTLVRQRVLLLI